MNTRHATHPGITILLLSALLVAGCGDKTVEPPAPTTGAPPSDQSMQAAKEAGHSAVENLKEAASDTATAAKEAGSAMVEKTKEAANSPQAQETKAKVKEAAEQAVDKTKEAAAHAADATREAAAKAADATKEAVNTAATKVADATTPAPAAAPATIPDWVALPKYDCRSCHAIDHKVVGPAWKDVAERYKGQAGAEAMLMDKVKKGGKGNWDKETGGIPMTPHPALSDADLKKVVDFVLSLAR